MRILPRLVSETPFRIRGGGDVPEIAYLDFDLEIEPAADGYRVEVNSPAGQSTSAFKLPFSDLEIENFLLKIGQSRRVMRRIDAPETEAVKAFGARLFDAAFAGEARACLRSSIDEANRQNRGLRIRLRLNDTPELAGLPWEYLYNSALNRFLALSIETPVVRYLELPEWTRPLAITPPLRILAMIANPRDQAPLNVEREWGRLREALGGLEQQGLVTLERLEQASLVELQRRLRRGAYHILHFVGHGGFDKHREDGMLVLEGEDGLSYRISGQELGMLLHDHRSLRLAMLNSCDGARASRIDPFSGTAQSLVQQGLPAVIAMQFEVSDDAAIALAREFYGALADGYPVDAALAEARKALFAAQSGVEWGTPVLYLRASDGRIFDVAPVATPPEPAKHSDVPEPIFADDPPQLEPLASAKKATTIQGRLSAMGCQVSLFVQVTALLVVLIGIGAVYGANFLHFGGSAAPPPTTAPGANATSAPGAAPTVSGLPPTAGRVPTDTPAPTVAPVPSPAREPTAAAAPYAAWASIRVPLATIETNTSINTVAVSPDGKLIAAGGQDNIVRIWDLATQKLVHEFRQSTFREDRVTSLAFSPNGTLLASAGAGNDILLWRVADGTIVHRLSGPDRHTKRVQSLAFAPSGLNLASGSDDQTIKIWRVDDGVYLRTLRGHTSPVWGVAFSPDSQQLASGAFASDDRTVDAQVRLWRVSDGALVRMFSGPSAGIMSVAFSHDGTKIAAGSWDNYGYLWNADDGAVIGRMEGHAQGIGGIVFSPDDTVVATAAGDGNARLFSAVDGSYICALHGHSNWATGLAFSPDGQRLISGSADRTIRIWGPRS